MENVNTYYIKLARSARFLTTYKKHHNIHTCRQPQGGAQVEQG